MNWKLIAAVAVVCLLAVLSLRLLNTSEHRSSSHGSPIYTYEGTVGMYEAWLSQSVYRGSLDRSLVLSAKGVNYHYRDTSSDRYWDIVVTDHRGMNLVAFDRNGARISPWIDGSFGPIGNAEGERIKKLVLKAYTTIHAERNLKYVRTETDSKWYVDGKLVFDSADY